MDPLEDIFTAMHIESALYARLQAKAPWGIAFDTSPNARYAIVVRGHCWLSAASLPQPIALTGGDCFIVKGEAEFQLQDELGHDLQACNEIFHENAGDTVAVGGDGALTEIVAGRFAFDSSGGEPLLPLLPSVLHIRMDSERARLLQATLQLIAMETTEQSMGARLVVNRLADVLFMQAVRAYCTSEDCRDSGWLSAFTDRRLGAALRAMHAEIDRSWTVNSLAAIAGMSRSAFAQRFKTVVGDTPLNYLSRWRIYRAKTLLRQSELALIEIAQRVGYETDVAFNRAFKRTVGLSPGKYRSG